MKKFLTVLLVIAVMFTFSFSSAFATLQWTGESTSKYLTAENDYTAAFVTGSGDVDKTKGTEGITEAYRAELTSEAKAMLSYAKKAGTFYAPEKAEAVAAIEAYIEALKTVKTAKDAATLKLDVEKKVGKWNSGTKAFPGGTLKLASDVLTDAKQKANGLTDKIDVTRILARADAKDDLYLPGYDRFVRDATVDTTTVSGKSIIKVDSKTAIGEIFASTDDNAKAIVAWFMDNDYRTKDEIKAGVSEIATAFTPVNTAYKTTYDNEIAAIQKEMWAFEDKALKATKRGLSVAELEALDALVKKINDFNEKYAGYNADGSKSLVSNTLAEAISSIDHDKASLAFNYFSQYYAETAAVPEVKKLTDADKATVIALYKKVEALGDSYSAVWKFGNDKTSGEINTGVNATYVDDYAKLKAAYKHFIEADVKAFKNLADFDAYTKGGAQNDTDLYYFDASEKNVSAMKAQRAAYDALVSNYGYSDLADTNLGAYTTAVATEAKLIAGEHNQGADAAYDVKDTKKLQAYLNNATLKVTTKALGNSKIRVNARFDAETYKDIVAECGNDYTISYKFYHKTAKANAFKGPKEKDRNYITYTKLSVKKGVKYKFQCGVVIKDAQGNVVAEKSYKASTTGSRVCR